MARLDPALIDLPGVQVRIIERCASTNSLLMKEPGDGTVILAAESQTAGRGRRGRRWHSTPGADLTFSLAVTLSRPSRDLATLPLVAGVAVTRALRASGLARAALKWPNDLMVDGAKVGGILVETRVAALGTRCVIGIGINCRHAPGLASRLRRPVACLEAYCAVDRNLLVRRIAQELLPALQRFERLGFEAAQWEALDAHAGQRLRVRLADGRTVSGIACGVAPDGALCLRNRRGVQAVRSGRVVHARTA